MKNFLLILILFPFTKVYAENKAFLYISEYAREVQNGKENGVTSFIVFQNDKVLHESYAPTVNRNDLHDLRSVTKSISALLITKAIEDEILPHRETKILTLIDQDERNNSAFSNIRINDLLTMQTGLACDDWVPASLGNEDKMYLSANWVTFFLSLPVSHEAGKHFSYCTGGAIFLGHVLNSALNNNLESWAEDKLFTPLEIKKYKWSKTPYGELDTGGHLYMKPIDLIKIGQLILNKGSYQKKRIISSKWIKRITSVQTKVYERPYHYGYWWWLDIPQNIQPNEESKPNLIFAWGNGGQYLFISPKHDIIFVFTGTNYNDKEMLLPQKHVKNWLRYMDQ